MANMVDAWLVGLEEMACCCGRYEMFVSRAIRSGRLRAVMVHGAWASHESWFRAFCKREGLTMAPRRKLYSGDYECQDCGQVYELDRADDEDLTCECGGVLEEVDEDEVEDEAEEEAETEGAEGG